MADFPKPSRLPSLLNLDAEQKARADALLAARRALVQSGQDLSVIDLVALAGFVLTGEDPYEVVDTDDDPDRVTTLSGESVLLPRPPLGVVPQGLFKDRE